MMKKWTVLLLALALTLGLSACSVSRKIPDFPEIPALPEIPDLPDPGKGEDGGTDLGENAALYVSHTDVTLTAAGDGFRLSVWTAEDGGPPESCAFTSADPSVAEVDETGGGVTAVAPGTTVITAHVEHEGAETDFDCAVRCEWPE